MAQLPGPIRASTLAKIIKKGVGIMKYLISWIKEISFNIFVLKVKLENPGLTNTIAREPWKGNSLLFKPLFFLFHIFISNAYGYFTPLNKPPSQQL